jgi:hypothetical protein
MKLKNTYTYFASAFAFLIATSCCWLPPLVALLAGATGLAAFSGWFDTVAPWLMAIGGGLFGWSVFKIWKKREGRLPVLDSVIKCPSCGFSKKETMPTEACQFFYECENCHILLKPKPGDCCVFCSYGSVKCPPIQLGEDCCT